MTNRSLSSKTDASFRLVRVGCIKNVVNHHLAPYCRGYRRFASILVADIKGQMSRAYPKPDNYVSNRIFVA